MPSILKSFPPLKQGFDNVGASLGELIAECRSLRIRLDQISALSKVIKDATALFMRYTKVCWQPYNLQITRHLIPLASVF
jgi:hypothetical protein